MGELEYGKLRAVKSCPCVFLRSDLLTDQEKRLAKLAWFSSRRIKEQRIPNIIGRLSRELYSEDKSKRYEGSLRNYFDKSFRKLVGLRRISEGYVSRLF